MTGWAPLIQLPELQSLLYQQEGDTLFTVEYDIARQVPLYASRVPFYFFVHFVGRPECLATPYVARLEF